MKISIGTLSRAFGLSDEALRFYEKKGLLHPVRENGNGYRVFELADIQRISNIQRLKSQGFTLEEIQRMYSGSGRQELEALYREKIAEMERKIAYDNHVLARMSASARTLQTAQEQLMRPVRLSLGRVYLLEYPSVPDMWARVEREPLLKRLFGALPLTAYTTLIGREALDGAPPRMTKGILFHENDAEVLGFETDAFRCIDATCAVGCLFRLENGGFDAGELLEHLFAYMSEHRLRASDDLFTQQLVSYVDENSNAIHYARMIVPVGPEKSPA